MREEASVILQHEQRVQRSDEAVAVRVGVQGAAKGPHNSRIELQDQRCVERTDRTAAVGIAAT
jgi:hypothetical protein